MINPTWALLWIALGAIPRAGPGDEATVLSAELEVFDVPEDGAFAVATLRQNDRVTVVGDAGEGWLAIEPPKGSFDWVDRSAIELDDENERSGAIKADRARIRAGRVDARMPGPPRGSLARGTRVTLLDQPPLILRQGSGRRAWLAIASRPTDRRYIRAEGIGGTPPKPGRFGDGENADLGPGQVDIRPIAIPTIDASLVAVAPQPRESGLPAALDAELRSIEARHRRALRDPIDRWELEPIRVDYQALLDRESDPKGQAALRDRLGRVSRQARASRSVSNVETLLDRSRELDRVTGQRTREAESEAPKADPFDADGVLQASSRQVNGHRVWALVGGDGEVCFLDIPPALDVKSQIDRRVGVRGSVRYDDSLRARLIRVQDLEPLGRATLKPR